MFGTLVDRSLFLSNPNIFKAFSTIVGSGTWVRDAFDFDVYTSKSRELRRLVSQIYDEVAQEIPISSPSKTRDVIKTTLINLWITAYLHKPVRYSRDRSFYTSARRYGRLFLKYDRLIPVIDALEGLGYLEQRIGFKVWDKEIGFQTRMWATDRLVAKFEKAGLKNPGFFTASRINEYIILKDTQGRKVQYIETQGISRRRKQLTKYNNHINNSRITVVLNSQERITYRFLLLFLHSYVIKGMVKIVSVKQYQTGTTRQYSDNYNLLQQYHYIYTTMTQKKQPNHSPVGTIDDSFSIGLFMDFVGDINTFARGFSNKDHAEGFLNQEYALQELGIERLEFQLMDEELHRVYNRSFNYGGRAYGALHQNLPRDLRPLIHIDDQQTEELDFSAHHIRMLYHMQGLDYRPDPYIACEGKAMRNQYKSVALIAINAANTREASGAIYDDLKKHGLPLPTRSKPIKSMIDIFKMTHEPIRRHLFSGVGLELQNKDSDIMNAILVRLTDMGIAGLPVHDSVIVQARHKDILGAVMVDEYRQLMGFEPVIK
nr:hypothetical protein [uncultured Desulfobacter sp.]